MVLKFTNKEAKEGCEYVNTDTTEIIRRKRERWQQGAIITKMFCHFQPWLQQNALMSA